MTLGRLIARRATSVAVISAAVTAVAVSPATAYWSGTGSGSGQAAAADVVAPTVTAEAPAYSTDVSVAWSPGSAPAGLPLSGYLIERRTAGHASRACGSAPGSLIAPTATSCVDTAIPDGTYTYAVTAVYGAWTGTGLASAPVTVAADHAPPAVALTSTNNSNTLLAQRSGSYRLFFRPAAAGSIVIDAAVTDNETGPASATFPNPSAAGWTHPSETVTTGSGLDPTIVYRSTAFSYAAAAAVPATMTIVGADFASNLTSVPVAFQSDSTAPTGGVVTVNGITSTAVGSTSQSATGTFSITTITPFAEASTTTASGLASSDLVRQVATLTANACGPFGPAVAIEDSAPVAQSLSDGCYRYTLTGTDNVGNVSTTTTTVKVDATPPDGGELTVNSGSATVAGTTSTNRTGGYAVNRTDFVDAQSGISASTLVRTQATLSGGTCGPFATPSTLAGSPMESGLATRCYRYTLTATNTYGGASSLVTTVLVDTVAPTGGGLTVNAVAATAAGSTSNNSNGTVTVSVLTGLADANSGMNGSVLTRTSAPLANGVCGTFDPDSMVSLSGPAPVTNSSLSPGCYRYTLTGTDNAGNTASLFTTVRVDTTAPTGGAMSANGTDATGAGSISTATTGTWSLTRTDFTDSDSGITGSTLVRTYATLSGGVCGSYGSASTITGAPTQSGLSTRCYRYILTGTNALGLISTLQTIVRLDTTVPTGGALTVNAAAGTTAGSTSNNGTGAFSVTAATAYADTQSGMSTNTLVRTTAPLAGGTCGTYDPDTATTITEAVPLPEAGLPTSCYRYVLTGTNTVGGSAALTTTVKVDTTAPSGGALTVNSTDADVNATSSTATTAGFTISRTDFTDPDSTMTVQTLGRSSATLSAGNCGTFGATTVITGSPVQTGLSTACYRYILTGTNSSGLTSTLTTIVKLDTTAPTGGAITVNAVAASAAGTASTSITGNFSVSVLTDYVDTHSGLASSTLVRTTAPVAAGVCGTFDPSTAMIITGPVPVGQNSMPNGCYRFTLTGTNAYGGVASTSTTVRVDTTAPTAAALTINGVDATAGGSTSTSPVGNWTIARIDFTDPETAMTVQTLVRTQATLTNNTCGTFGTTTTIPASTTTETGLATNCYRYLLTGTNSLGLTTTLSTIVKLDTSGPTGGALAVNGTSASSAGTNSSSAAGTFNITAVTAMADTNSGMTGTVLTRTQAPVTAGVCGVFDSGTTITISGSTPIAQTSLAPGCYQYVLTGTNNFGGSSTLTTTVKVGS